MEPDSNKSANGSRVIPIQIEGAAPKINQSKRWGNAKDNNETAQSTINNRYLFINFNNFIILSPMVYARPKSKLPICLANGVMQPGAMWIFIHILLL